MAVYKSKTPTKDGRIYFFRIKYKDILGKVHDYSSPKYKSQKDAINEEAIYRIKVANQNICTSTITFGQAFNEYIATKQVKKQTIKKIQEKYKHLEILKDIKINNIDLQKYKLIVKNLDDNNFSVSHKNKILNLFKSIIKFSNLYYNTNDSILKYVIKYKDNNLKKEMDFFTYEEYKQFDSVVNEFEYHLFFEILYFLGLRQGEAQALTWNDINFEKSEIKITKTLTTKLKDEIYTVSVPKTKNSIRILPIPKKLLNDLKMHNEAVKKYKDYTKNWFIFGGPFPFKESTIQKKKNKYCDQAGLKRIRVHDFRHSCATLLINKGASIMLVSKYLGHASISITLDVYTHLYKNELVDVTKVLDNL